MHPRIARELVADTLGPGEHCSEVTRSVLSIFDRDIPVTVGRHSSVSIATRYGLDGPRIESRWRREFPHPSRPDLRPTQPPIR
jgi:hypothetical protein